ncbi:MAG: Rieske 2Fe-2S domain-containing protein [Planctomycetes bacterium]|nr:Rieske 2Fe-2S domain-containing protein [Planctomycetota bacterium]
MSEKERYRVEGSPGAERSQRAPAETAHDVAVRDITLPSRRSFFVRASAVLIGGIVSLFPLAAGLFTFLDPLRPRKGAQRRDSGGSAMDDEGFVDVTTLEALPEDGTPQLFQIIADRKDAWTFIPNQPIGAVYLRKEGDDVIAFSVACPHAGCAVDFDPVEREFECPCHRSSFTLAGERSGDSPSARNLDRLNVKNEEGRVKVRYQNFRTGVAEQIPE